MITTLISLLVAALLLYLVFYITGLFIKGRPLSVVGIVLGLLFLLYALRTLHIVSI